MATSAAADYAYFQAFAPTLAQPETVITPLLARAHTWSQTAIASLGGGALSAPAENRVKDAECQYVICLLQELPTGSVAGTGRLKSDKHGDTEQEYFHPAEGNASGVDGSDCYQCAWDFLYQAGVSRPAFFAGATR